MELLSRQSDSRSGKLGELFVERLKERQTQVEVWTKRKQEL